MNKVLGTALLIALSICPPIAAAKGLLRTTVSCFCKASPQRQSFQPNPSAIFYDLTGSVALSFTGGPGVAFMPANMSDCSKKCASVARNEKSQIAAAACARGIADGSTIYIDYSLGTRPYFDLLGWKLINKPTSDLQGWICPSPWLSNTSNQINGLTADGRCKKLHGTYTGPAFPNGTQLGGNSDFTWGNEIWVYGNSANGGAAVYQHYGWGAGPVCAIDGL